MNSNHEQSRSTPNKLGDLLRYWRGTRGKSQFDLSLVSGISQRHISFIESGRSAPSRQALIDLAQALDVPLRERNAILLAAGYAPVYAETVWNAHDMQSINSALERMLRQHEPYPAVVMDRYWNVLSSNDAAPRLFNRFVDLSVRAAPRNMLHLMFDPAGMRPFIANWEATSHSLMQRVYREAVGAVVDPQSRALLDELLAYPDVESPVKTTAKADRTLSKDAASAPDLPMIPLQFVKDGKVLSYFSMVTTVGTPQTVAAQELRIESMFPADTATETEHLRLMGLH